jgi:hypothetical protein
MDHKGRWTGRGLGDPPAALKTVEESAHACCRRIIAACKRGRASVQLDTKSFDKILNGVDKPWVRRRPHWTDALKAAAWMPAKLTTSRTKRHGSASVDESVQIQSVERVGVPGSA